jgi:hypothetical protein
MYASFGSSSSNQWLTLFLDYVAQVKKSIASFFHFSCHLDLEYSNAMQKEMGAWPQKVYNKISLNIREIPIRMCAKLEFRIG